MLNLLQRFRGRPVTDAPWRDPELVRDREDVAKHVAILTKLEREWEALESRTDFVADKRREELRAMLPPLYSRRDTKLRRLAAREEHERIVNTSLRPLYAQKLGALEGRFERMATNPDVPEDDDWCDLLAENLEVERLRLALHEATHLDEFRRAFDAPRMLREHWAGVHRDRERLFALMGPGNKPRLPGDLPWLAHARRLSELRVASTPQKEPVHAAR